MTIRTHLSMGLAHSTHCEDFLYEVALDSHLHLAVVMDGCSSGTESHFAATLAAKILRKRVRELQFLESASKIPQFIETPLSELGKTLFQALWQGFKETQHALYLDTLELLTTLNLALIRPQMGTAWINLIGDGYVGVKRELIEVDQDNRPDYMAYHLKEDFDEWFAQAGSTFTFQNLSQLYLATDGIGSFHPMKSKAPDFEASLPEFFLFGDTSYPALGTFDKRKHYLKERHGIVATDDIAIIHLRW